MKIAGLDLSNLNEHSLTTADYDIIYRALVKNIELIYGDIDRRLPAQIIANLRRYMKINTLNKSLLNSGSTSGKPDLNLALCIYMLPEEAKDPKVSQYLEIITNLNLESNQVIKFLRSQPFKFDHLVKIAKIVQLEKEKLNRREIWESNASEVFAYMSDQLIFMAYDKLYQINKELGDTHLAVATKAIFFMEILHYVNKRRNDQGFKLLMDLYQSDQKSLRGFTKQVLILLKDSLMQLDAMPEQSHQALVSSCGLLLYRATCLLRQGMAAAQEPQSDNKKVAPGP